MLREVDRRLGLTERVARALDRAVREAMMAAWAENTRRGYRSQGRLFAEWCEAEGLECAPATPETVARYLTARAKDGIRTTTIGMAKAAIDAIHEEKGWLNPCASTLVRRMMKGLCRQDTRPQRQATALSADGFRAILGAAATPRSIGPRLETPAEARTRATADVAIVAVLFQAGLRRSEAAALRWEDVGPARGRPKTIQLRVRKSKTDQDGSRLDYCLLKGEGAKAVEALRKGNTEGGELVFEGCQIPGRCS